LTLGIPKHASSRLREYLCSVSVGADDPFRARPCVRRRHFAKKMIVILVARCRSAFTAKGILIRKCFQYGHAVGVRTWSSKDGRYEEQTTNESELDHYIFKNTEVDLVHSGSAYKNLAKPRRGQSS
jgi:hypothetical protein